MIILSIALLLALQSPQQTVAPLHTVQMAQPEVVKVTVGSDGSLQVQSAAKLPFTFYLFDLQGTMVYQVTLKRHESKTVDGLSKGTYLYSAFQNDESIEEGKVTLR